MCVILIAGKGTDKYSDFFTNAIRIAGTRNRDGFGFAYKKASTKTVYMAKGFMVMDRMIDEIKCQNLKEEDELIVHVRMKSAGAITPENTHPFELNYANLNSPVSYATHGKTTLYPVMFHNGTFADFKDFVLATQMSDTYHFANNFMKSRQIWNFLKEDSKKFIKTFRDVIGFNKLVFLSRECPMITIGEFITDNGYIFSNTGYKSTLMPFNYSSNVQQRPKITDRTEDGPVNSLNTNIVKIDKTNFNHFYLKSHCRSVGGGSKIEEGEYFVIKTYNDKDRTCLLEEKNYNGSFKFISFDVLDSVFIRIPKPGYSKRYMDYIKLVGKVEATKSAIKKIFNKVLQVSGRKKSGKPETIDIKYKNNIVKYDYIGVLMFLNDYKHYIDAYRVDELLKLSEPIEQTKEVILLPAEGASCEC